MLNCMDYYKLPRYTAFPSLVNYYPHPYMKGVYVAATPFYPSALPAAPSIPTFQKETHPPPAQEEEGPPRRKKPTQRVTPTIAKRKRNG